MLAGIISNYLPAGALERSRASVNVDGLSKEVLSLEAYDQFFKDLGVGSKISADQVRNVFERAVRDDELIRKEVGKFKVAQLQQMVNFPRSDDRKADLVDRVTEGKMGRFAYIATKGSLFTIRGVGDNGMEITVRELLASLTDVGVVAYQEHLNIQAAERAARLAAAQKALDNPETLDEFNFFVKKKGETALNTEQRARRDELVSASLREKADKERAESAQVAGLNVSSDVKLIDTVHTRDKYPLFVVQLEERVDRDEYSKLLEAAKRLGGWYSKYRGDGAVPGFQFKVKSDAEVFMGIARGKDADISGKLEARREQVKLTAVQRLRQMSRRLSLLGEASLNHRRKANTARRARMASSAEQNARELIAMGVTMANVAQAIESGTANHLATLREKTQIQLLNRYLASAHIEFARAGNHCSDAFQKMIEETPTEASVDFLTFPYYVADAQRLAMVGNNCQTVSGLHRLSQKFIKCATGMDQSKSIRVNAEMVEEIFQRLGSRRAEQLLPWQWAKARYDRAVLARMNVTAIEQLRAACREFVKLISAPQGADKVKQLERALIRKKVGIDFFPTPRHIAQKMVEMAGVVSYVSDDGSKPTIIEPSAGNGNIADAIRAAGFEPDVCEMSANLREILDAKGFKVVGKDCLELNHPYRFIIANPPFGANMDITHTRHAYDKLLEPGGVLVTIIGEGAFYRQGKVESEFRAWLDELSADVEKLPDGTFMDSELLATTGTAARIVRISKPDA